MLAARSNWLTFNIAFFAFAMLLAMTSLLAITKVNADVAEIKNLPSPSKEVGRVTQNLLTNFQKKRLYYQKNVDKYIDEVESQLSPVVAFDSIAKGVMGRYARQVDEKTTQKFQQVFKSSLINFYGKALLKLESVDVAVKSISPVPDQTIKDYMAKKIRQVPVNMEVKTASRTVGISYSMVFIDNNWKLRNVIVDGINVGIQFRRQFADAVREHQNVEFVVDNWLDIMSGNIKNTGKN